MTAILELDEFETKEELGYTQEQVQKLVFDNWLDSGYRLVLPEKDLWYSDDYQKQA